MNLWGYSQFLAADTEAPNFSIFSKLHPKEMAGMIDEWLNHDQGEKMIALINILLFTQ